MSDFEEMQGKILACEKEISKEIIGQREVIRNVMLSILSGGNVLLEGMPGLGKTRLVNTISHVLNLSFKRIQFTPDLMPGDITGTNIMMKDESGSGFKFEPGPVFANIILADEISPDTCRLWDSTTHEKLDKDRFRRDLGGVEEAYAEVFKRLAKHGE